MIITVICKYIVREVPYLKHRIVCDMHKNMNSETIIANLLPPHLFNECDSLCFEYVVPALVSQFKKLFMMVILIKYLSKLSYSVTQHDAKLLYFEIENETLMRCCYSRGKNIGYHFSSEMCVTLTKHVVTITNALKLYCDPCSCVNTLEFNCNILCRHFKLHERHDLAYEIISNIKFQHCFDVCVTINDEMDNLKLKLSNTGDKMITILLGRHDINSLTSLLCHDIITLIVYNFIHNVQDKWIKMKIM